MIHLIIINSNLKISKIFIHFKLRIFIKIFVNSLILFDKFNIENFIIN